MKLVKCVVCDRLIVEEYASRGCWTHSVDRQIKKLYPFITFNIKDSVKHNGHTIKQYEMVWAEREDRK